MTWLECTATISMAASFAALAAACGGKVLDLGHDTGAPAYATRETIVSERDAGPGVPTIMASNQYGASAIAIDETRVYWAEAGVNPQQRTENGVVRSCAKEDCASTLITYAIEQLSVNMMVVNDTHVFWNTAPINNLTRSSIVACPLAGCNGQPIGIVPGPNALRFAVDESFIYVLTYGGPMMGAVVRCPIRGCQGTPTVLANLSHVPDELSWSAFAIDAMHVFWIEGQDSSTTSGTIMMVPKDGSAGPQALAEGGHLVNSLAVDHGKMYWAEGYTKSTVKTCELPNCGQTVTTLAASQPYPYFVNVNGDRAYWFALTGGSLSSLLSSSGLVTLTGQIVECPLAGGSSPLTLLASDQTSPSGLASDATHIYWTTFRDEAPLLPGGIMPAGAVKRVRRSR
ncbi:MAG TPA: hypothetical protein VK550_27245 [Polyangiaceae bacterium]|nr:hypothetical protein [Polyangiaceae bacterium]